MLYPHTVFQLTDTADFLIENIVILFKSYIVHSSTSNNQLLLILLFRIQYSYHIDNNDIYAINYANVTIEALD